MIFFTTIFLTSLFHFQKISSGLNPQEVNSAKNNEINKLLYTDEDSQVLKCISLLILFLLVSNLFLILPYFLKDNFNNLYYLSQRIFLFKNKDCQSTYLLEAVMISNTTKQCPPGYVFVPVKKITFL